MNTGKRINPSLVALIALLMAMAYIVGRYQTTLEIDKQTAIKQTEPKVQQHHQSGIFASDVSYQQEEKVAKEEDEYAGRAQQLLEHYIPEGRMLTDHEIRELREIIKKETGGTYYLHTPGRHVESIDEKIERKLKEEPWAERNIRR